MNIIKLPGLVDVHVHLRDDQTQKWAYKESFESGTQAAVAGGYTFVIDMPNNPDQVTTASALHRKKKHATGRVYCDVGFHFGGGQNNENEFEGVVSDVFGLKVYMNHTTGSLLIEDDRQLEKIFKIWPSTKPILTHSEGETMDKAIHLAKMFKKRLHICHVSLGAEIERVKQEKESGMDITCEVACHHLFLQDEDVTRLGPFGVMKPPLATEKDRDLLWEYIDFIDCIASDHAPHTKEEKEGSESAPFGVPGLQTSLPLMLSAVHDKRITLEKMTDMMSYAPRKIFAIPEQSDTYIEVDMDAEYMLRDQDMLSKAAWTPFDEMIVKGKLLKTVLRGEIVFDGVTVSESPHGRVL